MRVVFKCLSPVSAYSPLGAAPDIDGCVYITRGTVEPGALVDVTITEAHTYDLVGEIKETG